MPDNPQDPFDLQRFVAAQNHDFPSITAELQRGRKSGHWMWFVFPQLRGLGHSEMARHYAISGRDEAAAYLAHGVLGPRLRHCTALVLAAGTDDPVAIFGPVDALKFRSSMTLFDRLDPGTGFADALARFCQGRADPQTLAGLARG